MHDIHVTVCVCEIVQENTEDKEKES